MSLSPRCNVLIFDLGDVLWSWSPKTSTSIPPRTLKTMLHSPTWALYECARISQEECYRTLGEQYSISQSEIAVALQDACDSLVANDEFIEFILTLKEEATEPLRVYAMSNISQPDYEELRRKPARWDVFDEVFTSAAAGMRKPNIGFFKHVLSQTKADPRRTVFVDDKPDNVLSARSLGLHGIVWDKPENVRRVLRYLVGDAVLRGRAFLSERAGRLDSETDTGETIGDNFAQLLILEATNDRSLVKYEHHPGKWNFFREAPQLTTTTFPYDLDTTSIGTMVTHADEKTAGLVMDEILQYLTEDNIVMTYFDHERPRTDPVVCVNVLSLFYSHGRGSELQPTVEWVFCVLEYRAYLDGTRYYETAECFLYFLSRLLESTNDEELHAKIKPLLKERLQERIGEVGDALALAMRILACTTLGIKDEVDLRKLLALQWEDGGWEVGWVYKYGSTGVKIGNRGLTTAMAIKAIESMGSDRMRASTPTVRVTLSPPQDVKRPFSSMSSPTPSSSTVNDSSRPSFKENVKSALRAVNFLSRKRQRTLSAV